MGEKVSILFFTYLVFPFHILAVRNVVRGFDLLHVHGRFLSRKRERERKKIILIDLRVESFFLIWWAENQEKFAMYI